MNINACMYVSNLNQHKVCLVTKSMVRPIRHFFFYLTVTLFGVFLSLLFFFPLYLGEINKFDGFKYFLNAVKKFTLPSVSRCYRAILIRKKFDFYRNRKIN